MFKILHIPTALYIWYEISAYSHLAKQDFDWLLQYLNKNELYLVFEQDGAHIRSKTWFIGLGHRELADINYVRLRPEHLELVNV